MRSHVYYRWLGPAAFFGTSDMRCNVPVLLWSLVAIIPNPPESSGCAPVPRDKEWVGVNSEEAIIFYDAATRREHFIRRADFRTTAKDFGFLVPTPTRPELGETESQVFSTLQLATAPRHVPSGHVRRIVVKRSKMDAPTGAAPSREPTVLDRQRVAGYDAVVLRAEDTEGLKKWLEDNHYNARPAVMDWLKWYVENKWIITAFKIASDGEAARDRWALSVRMSFETDAPFYPYREPEDMRSPTGEVGHPPQRKLRIYFLADDRYGGMLGRNGVWAARTVWSNACPKQALIETVKGIDVGREDNERLFGKAWRLTEFEDESSPRLGTDEVYFRRADDQSTVERPVIYYDNVQYVYEDDAPTGGGKLPTRGEQWWYVGLILKGIGVAFVLAAIRFLVMRRRQPQS